MTPLSTTFFDHAFAGGDLAFGQEMPNLDGPNIRTSIKPREKFTSTILYLACRDQNHDLLASQITGKSSQGSLTVRFVVKYTTWCPVYYETAVWKLPRKLPRPLPYCPIRIPAAPFLPLQAANFRVYGSFLLELKVFGMRTLSHYSDARPAAPVLRRVWVSGSLCRRPSLSGESEAQFTYYLWT